MNHSKIISLTIVTLLIISFTCIGNVEVKAATGPIASYYLYLLQAPVPANQATAYNLIIIAKDASNNTVASGGSVNLTTTDSNAIKPTVLTINSNGFGSCTFYFGTPGSQTITVTNSTDNTITGSLTATVSPVHFNITVSPTIIYTNQTVSVSVSALNATNDVLTDLGNSGYGNSLSFVSTDSQAIFPNAGLLSDLVNGVGIFNITLPTVGSQTVTVIDKAFPLVNATTNAITVNPQPTATPSASPSATSSPSPTVTPTQSVNPTATPTTATTTTPNNQNQTNPTGTNQALIIGIVAAILVIVVVSVVFALRRTKSHRKTPLLERAPTPPPPPT